MLKQFLGALLVVAVFLGPFASDAQEPEKWRFRQFQVDNDLYHFPYRRGTDQFYTSGLRVSFTKGAFESADGADSLPLWLRPVRNRCAHCVIYPTFSVGQQMYTPEDLENPLPQPGDRPWVAWLYTSLGGAIDTSEKSRHDIEFQFGVTGDAAGGEFGQKFWHELTGSPDPHGWDNQFGPDLGINAYYNFQHIWKVAPEGIRMDWDFVPSVKAAVGTMKTNVGVGGMFRAGRNITDFPYAPLRPNSRRNLATLPNLEVYGFVGADVRAIAYDYTLEGSLFSDEPFVVHPKRYVWDLTIGMTARFRRYNISYAVVRRSEEFDRTAGDDSGVHVFGSLSFTVGIR